MAHFIVAALLSWKDTPLKRENCSIDELPQNATLTQLGLCTGTDKAHASMFTQFYPFVLDRMRPLAFNMIEIGVAAEGSLKMWDRYFPKASIFGADAMPYKSPRILRCHQGRQEDVVSLGAFRPWSVILDDGSHKPTHMLNTFVALFPGLPPGGIYILEDIETSYWARGKGRGHLITYHWNMRDENEQSDVVERFLEARARPPALPSHVHASGSTPDASAALACADRPHGNQR